MGHLRHWAQAIKKRMRAKMLAIKMELRKKMHGPRKGGLRSDAARLGDHFFPDGAWAFASFGTFLFAS